MDWRLANRSASALRLSVFVYVEPSVPSFHPCSLKDILFRLRCLCSRQESNLHSGFPLSLRDCCLVPLGHRSIYFATFTTMKYEGTFRRTLGWSVVCFFVGFLSYSWETGSNISPFRHKISMALMVVSALTFVLTAVNKYFERK